MNQKIFKRYELKYLLTIEQYNLIKQILNNYMVPDNYLKSTIRNIYYDTLDFLMIRNSIEKPLYKEKIRIRTYQTINNEDEVFVELKKKYDGVVYKRREIVSYQNALNFLTNKEKPFDSQIINEINYLLHYYKTLKPAMFISYKREAYIGNDDKKLRITFDTDILWRDYDIDLTKEPYGEKVLGSDFVLMEVKTIMGLPKWLLEFLGNNKIYKQSFSKYGNAYKQLISKESEEKSYA